MKETLIQVSERQRELLVALSALLVFALVLSLLQYARLQDRQLKDLETQAAIVAQTVSAALVFESRSDASDILSALQRSPSIEHARLLKKDGGVFTQYSRLSAERSSMEEWSGNATVEVPIEANGQRVGKLVLEASRLPMYLDLAQFLGATVATLVGAVGLAWLLSNRLRAQMKEVERRTRYLARFDALTDLPNREQMRGLLERALAHGGGTLLILNLDDFKQINDQYRHAAGDAVLQAVAERLRLSCRAGDQVARLSADEFAVLLNPGFNEEGLRAHITKMQKVLTQPVMHDGHWIQLHLCVGAVSIPEHARDPSEAMRCADAAMRHAKQLGKDSFQVFTPEIGEALRLRQALEHDLQGALSFDGQLSLAYQPQYDAQRRVRGFEALARWRHPTRGWISPVEFIPVAEKSGLIVDLGLAMLAILRRDLDAWKAQGINCPLVAVNLSWEQCRKPQHRERFLQQLKALLLTPSEIEFELTESAGFEDVDKPDSFIFTLQGLGYGLAIDDFGTGYSSLAYLRRMRCRKLKIDRFFIHGLSGNADARSLVESIINVAHGMHMQVVAEGVEKRADEEALVAMGCDLMQGFGFSRPLFPDQVPALLD
ncbi:MAG TPA: EAL domain-containing protein [Roseateles sp.]|nr:EAL domain-containing protein [Roseateles sp.]